jgi:hypothetical protein
MIVDHLDATARSVTPPLSRKALPLFAKELADARARGMTLLRPLVSVRLHDGGRPSAGFGVVVPNDKRPAELDWSWCRRLEVMIYREGDHPERLLEAIGVIEAARPRRLIVVDFGVDRVISIVDPADRERAPRIELVVDHEAGADAKAGAGEASSATTLLRTPKGAIKACEHNARVLMAETAQYAGLHFDEFRSRLRIDGRDWADADDLELLMWLQSHHQVSSFTLGQARHAAQALAHERRRDSLREFVEGLPPWDETPRAKVGIQRSMGRAR